MSYQNHSRAIPPPRQRFDDIATVQNFWVRAANASEVGDLLEFVIKAVPDIAATEASIKRILATNPQSVLVIKQGTETVGVYGLLLLNPRGLEALLTGALNFGAPGAELIAQSGERAAGIYLWVACSPGMKGATTGSIVQWLQRYEFRQASIFARPATDAGKKWMIDVGFEPIVCGQADLWRYARNPTVPANTSHTPTETETIYELPNPQHTVLWTASADRRSTQYFIP